MSNRYTPIQFLKGDSLIIDGVHFAIRENDKSGLTVQTLGDCITDHHSHDEIFEMYLDGRMTIVRGTRGKLPDGVRHNLKTSIYMFSEKDQKEALRRLEFVQLAIRLTSTKPYSKHPDDLKLVARVIARYRRLCEAKAQGKKSTEIGLEKVGGSTLRDWYWRYRNSGFQLVALVPLHDRKGRQEIEFDPEVIQIISKWVDGKYLTQERPSVTDTANLAIAEVERRNDLRTFQLRVPSISAIRLWIKKNVLDIEKTWYRRGKDEYEQQYRHVLKRTLPVRPLEEVQIDHVQLDIFVYLDDLIEGLDARVKKERVRIRPWLTLAICVATRMIAGWYISISPPNWESVMACLRMVMMPKNPEQYGASSPYPVVGVPERVRLDNGREFHSLSLKQMSGDAGFSIEWCPRRTPESKAHVERLNGTIARQFLGHFSGRTFRSVAERGDYDSEGRTRHTVSEIKNEFGFWVVDIYHKKEHAGIGRISPLIKWESLRSCGVRVPPEYALLKAMTGTTLNSKITNEGIKYKHLVYQSEKLQALRQRTRDRGREYVVKVDPIDMSRLLVLDGENGKWIDVPCVEQDKTKNLTHAELIERNRSDRAQSKRKMQKSAKEARAAMLEQEERLSTKRVAEAKLKQKTMREYERNPDPKFDITPTDAPSNDNQSRPNHHRDPKVSDAEEVRAARAGKVSKPSPSPQSMEKHHDDVSLETQIPTITIGDDDYA